MSQLKMKKISVSKQQLGLFFCFDTKFHTLMELHRITESSIYIFMSMYLFLWFFFRYPSLLPGEYSCLWFIASNCFVTGIVTTKIGVVTTNY